MKQDGNYYDLLECSPEASLDTIHHLIRFQLQRQDQAADKVESNERLKLLSSAMKAFKSPETRDQYDQMLALSPAAKGISPRDETEERYQVLSLLSTKRRTDLKNPGLPASSLAAATGLSELVIDFHLWYFMQKGWVQREESGVLSITAQGIDRIDEMNLARASKR